MIKFISKYSSAVLFVLLAVIIFFPIFLDLGYLPFRVWDESILGVNALEMAHNHNYIVTYFYGYPDMYRCKPPLMLWVIILFTKLFGFNELTLRLPSALAASALCIYLFFILRKITGNYLIGFFAVCVLVTCQGYIGIHITRTGEYDSFWLLFSTIFSFSLFMAVETEDKKVQSRNLLFFFVFITLGVLTKGLVCMLYMLPGFFVYVLMRKKAVALLSNRFFYIGLAVFLIFGMGYYFLRESMNPGYLKAVWAHEMNLNPRSVDLEIDGQLVKRFPVIFFLKRMVTSQFVSYMFIFPAALFVALRVTEPAIKRVVTFAAVIGFIYFVVISLPGKKVPHYDAPCFIYLGIIMAVFFYTLYVSAAKQLTGYNIPLKTTSVVAFLCILSLLGKPYYDIIKTVYLPKDEWGGAFSESCRFFQQAVRGNEDIDNCKLVLDASPGYGPSTVLTCYEEELAEHGKTVKFSLPDGLNVNDKAVVFDSVNKELINRHYETETIKHLDYCNADIISVKGIKIKP